MSLAPHAKKIVGHLLGAPNEDLSTKAQWRYGAKGSLAIEIAGDDAGAWFDHEAKAGGGLLDLIRREKGFSNGEAFHWLETELGIKGEGAGAAYKITATYVYRDRDGEPLYRVVRRDAEGKPKKIHQERYDPATSAYVCSKGCMDGVRYVPYRLPDWIDVDGLVLIAEGERKVDALYDRGWQATCNAGGAGKFSKGFSIYFTDRDVLLLPDNDQAGRDHVRQVAAVLEPVAASVRILELPGLPPKGDVIDWLEAGGTGAQLRALIEAAPTATKVIATWEPEEKEEAKAKPATEGVDNVIRLAALRPVDYDRVRKEEAKRLGVRASTLDAEVEKHRALAAADPGETAGKGQALGLVDPDPWHEPVDGDALLRDAVAAIRRYVVLSERAALACALWAIHAHTMEFATVAPRLLITAPTRECGKTVLLDTVSRLVPRALPAANISAAGIFRTAEVARPTLLIDEADTFLHDHDELRGVVNSGHTRASAFVIRVVDAGGDMEPRKFSTWCAMAIAGIGAMPGTITSRSIAIKMERKLPHERVARLTHRTGHDLNLICRKMARWVADNRSSLEAAEPAVPDQLGNRSADNWCELLGIAEAIGGEWPSRAREAAIARAGEDDGEVVAVQLLADIKEIFDTTGADKLLSSTIVDRLIEMEGRPWAEFGRARKPITPNAMARLLKPFKITPGSIRPDLQGRGTKGYERKAFDEVWRRYLPEGGINPAQRHNQGNPPISEDSQPAHAEPGVPDANRWKAAQSATCAVVPDRNPVPGQREEFDL